MRTVHIAFEPTERVSLAEVWNDLGHAQGFRYHPALGVLEVVEDANGVVTTMLPDDLGRIRQVIPQGQSPVAVEYAPRLNQSGAMIGLRVTTTEQGGSASHTDLDGLGRPVGEGHLGFDGTWIEQAMGYDKLGRTAWVSRPGNGAPSNDKTSFLYDNLDREALETLPDGKHIQSNHTFFETTTIAPGGRTRSVMLDRDGRIVQSIERRSPKDLVTSYHYAAFSQLERITDPEQNSIGIEHDQRGRRSAIHDPDAGLTELYYNGFGELKATVRDGGAVTQTLYDVLGRPYLVNDEEGTALYTWDTAAHGRGKLGATKSPDGTLQEFGYTPDGQPSTERWTVEGEAFEFERTYYPSGRLATLAYLKGAPGQQLTVQQSYTASGYLQDVYDASTSKKFWHVTSRNSDDALTQATLGNALTSVRTYDSTTGRLETLVEGAAMALAYDYDNDGHVSHRADAIANRIDTFAYDDLERLESWTVSTVIPGAPGLPDVKPVLRETGYHYGAGGNLEHVLVNKNAVQDNVYGETGKPHTLTSNGMGVFGYDERGRQVDAPGRTVHFTAFDLPRTITRPEGTTHFLYDAGHQRVKKQGPAGTVVSLGGLYERRQVGAQVQHVFYVQGSEGPVAEVVVDAVTGKPLCANDS